MAKDPQHQGTGIFTVFVIIRIDSDSGVIIIIIIITVEAGTVRIIPGTVVFLLINVFFLVLDGNKLTFPYRALGQTRPGRPGKRRSVGGCAGAELRDENNGSGRRFQSTRARRNR